jgi:hypothetical protein
MKIYIIVNDSYSNDAGEFTFEELQQAGQELGWGTELVESVRNDAYVVVDSNHDVVAVEKGHENRAW